jgi:nucleoside-diphosphate-sugar epimerase
VSRPPRPEGPALVTGASGFIGRHLVKALVAQGRRVLAFCRNPEGLSGLENPLLEVHRADLEEIVSHADPLREDMTVFHLASVRHTREASPERLHRVNVEATERLALAAAQARVARFVYVSTALVLGPTQGRRLTEADGLNRTFGEDAYRRSKVLAMERLKRLSENGLPLVTLYPTIVFGPDHLSRPNQVTGYLRRLLRSGVELLVGGGHHKRNLVYLDDVVRGICLAEKVGALGEDYILGGEDISHRELNQMALSLAGLRSRVSLSINANMALAAARAAHRVLGNGAAAAFVTRLERLTKEWRYCSEKAEQGLGYTCTPIRKGLEETIRFLSGGRP